MKNILIALLFAAIIVGLYLFIENRGYHHKKMLVVSVNEFYDMILKKDLDRLYEYLPDSLKQNKAKDDFIAATASYDKDEVLAAFSLVPITRYAIDGISTLDEERVEVTVIIYPEKKATPMKDIMIWKRVGNEWINDSYRRLVSGLVDSTVIEPAEKQQHLLETQMCKTRLQYLVIAAWEYTTEKNLTMDQFMSIPSEQWMTLLQENHLFMDNVIPQCPAQGNYTVSYDRPAGKMHFACTKHTSIDIPFTFGAVPAVKESENE
ncbi:MAG: hypothetical protein AB1454_06605 [Candidatus Auribacterota bacterium]